MANENLAYELKIQIKRLLQIAHAPEHADLCLEASRQAHRFGLIGEYLACCQKIVSLRPNWIDSWKEFSSALFFAGRMKESIAASLKAAALKLEIFSKSDLGKIQMRFFGDMWTGPIGHMTFLDSQAKSEILGLSPPGQRLLLPTQTSNRYYLEYWSKFFPLVAQAEIQNKLQPISESLLCDFEVWPFKDGRLLHVYQAIDIIQQKWELENRPPLLSFLEEDKVRGRQELLNLGMPIDAWFVVLHVRQPASDIAQESQRTARNAKLETYEKMVCAVIERGGWVVCMSQGEGLVPKQNLILYGPHRTDWMDVFLWANCKFFIGTASGPLHVPSTFGVPTVQTNSILGFRSWSSQDLFIPKRHWSKQLGRYLNLEEELRGPAAWCEWPEYLTEQGLDLHDNSPDEIEEVVIEMMDRLDGKISYSLIENQLQEQFRNIPKETGQIMFGNSKIGRAFLNRHLDLL
jgi:putative glycosyltransferase (TIGR04372 family)